MPCELRPLARVFSRRPETPDESGQERICRTGIRTSPMPNIVGFGALRLEMQIATIPREFANQRTKHTDRLHQPSATVRLMCVGLLKLAETCGDA